MTAGIHRAPSKSIRRGPPLRASLALLLAAFLAGVPAAAEACTTFLTKAGDSVLVAKSYDWHLEHGIVLTNPRGLAKTAVVLRPGDRAATWTSRYASVTFNQYGREFPNGGMNEKGLVIEVMWLDSSVYPRADERPAVSELQWIQYQLDTRASVAELVAHVAELRVSPIASRLHYMACDPTAACATIEFVAGKLRVTTGKDLVVPTLTNSTYAESKAFLDDHAGFGGKAVTPRDRSSLARFVRAATLARKAPARAAAAVTHAFSVLSSVEQGDYTKWNIVYDPKQLTVSWRSASAPEIKRVDFRRLAGGCDRESRVLDLVTAQGGDVTDRFAPYTDDANRRIVKASLDDLGNALPPGSVALLSMYPRSSRCVAEQPAATPVD